MYLRASVNDLLRAAETEQEVYGALLEAQGTYKEAGEGTRRKWRKTADQVLARIRTTLILAPMLLLTLSGCTFTIVDSRPSPPTAPPSDPAVHKAADCCVGADAGYICLPPPKDCPLEVSLH